MAKNILSSITLIALLALAFGQECGKPKVEMRTNRKVDPEGQRIVGGVEARPNSWPWIVSLQQYGQHFCGGSLISNGNPTETDIVLTAAHCLYDPVPQKLTVNAGAHDLKRPTNTQQTVRGIDWQYHEKYNPSTTYNDIALIKLDKPIKFNDYVQPICLPPKESDVKAGTESSVAGWGLLQEGGRNTSPVLMQLGQNIVDTKQCARVYGSNKIFADAMFCAGGIGGKDTCQGDSGGPFVVKEGDRYVLRGAVSWGAGCARPGVPGVYTRVSHYIDWINATIKKLKTTGGFTSQQGHQETDQGEEVIDGGDFQDNWNQHLEDFFGGRNPFDDDFFKN